MSIVETLGVLAHRGGLLVERPELSAGVVHAVCRWTTRPLAVTDSGGAGGPVVYLNGQFATHGYRRRVISASAPPPLSSLR